MHHYNILILTCRRHLSQSQAPSVRIFSRNCFNFCNNDKLVHPGTRGIVVDLIGGEWNNFVISLALKSDQIMNLFSELQKIDKNLADEKKNNNSNQKSLGFHSGTIIESWVLKSILQKTKKKRSLEIDLKF